MRAHGRAFAIVPPGTAPRLAAAACYALTLASMADMRAAMADPERRELARRAASWLPAKLARERALWRERGGRLP